MFSSIRRSLNFSKKKSRPAPVTRSKSTPAAEMRSCLKGPLYQKEHNFKVANLKTNRYCHYCGNYMWGLVHQGVQCSDCGTTAHKVRILPQEEFLLTHVLILVINSDFRTAHVISPKTAVLIQNWWKKFLEWTLLLSLIYTALWDLSSSDSSFLSSNGGVRIGRRDFIARTEMAVWLTSWKHRSTIVSTLQNDKRQMNILYDCRKNLLPLTQL